MFDVAIIGTGPAGLSAAITLKLHEKSILWFGSPQFSAKVEKSEKIANYPGAGLISGEELIADESENPEDEALRKLDLSTLRRALRTLSKEEMELITLLYLSEEPISENQYAQLLGVPQTTLNYRKEKIFKKIRIFFR